MAWLLNFLMKNTYLKFQMLECEGLDRYVDPRTLQCEIAEANDLTEADIDRAARELYMQPADNYDNNYDRYEEASHEMRPYSSRYEDDVGIDSVGHSPNDDDTIPYYPNDPRHQHLRDEEDSVVYVTTL